MKFLFLALLFASCSNPQKNVSVTTTQPNLGLMADSLFYKKDVMGFKNNESEPSLPKISDRISKHPIR